MCLGSCVALILVGDVHWWCKECGVIGGCVDGSEAVPLRFVAVLICRGCLGNDVLMS